MDQPSEARTANPVDAHVGRQVRTRRRVLGISQEKLANQLGLTFQQVQKYERGSNRISASKLYEIARALGSPVAYFFDGLADPTVERADGFAETGSEQFVHDFLMTQEGLELAEAFPRIREGRVRRKVLELVRTLSDGQSPAGAVDGAD